MGKLYNKFHNWKNSTRNAAEPKQKKRKMDSPCAIPASDQDHLRALKHDNLSFEEKLMHWKGCIATRLSSLQTGSSQGKTVSALWPMFKEPSGYIMVKKFF